ncbi:MAG: hypothetical protein H6612_06950 [Ignavibacteriales bacterium]|nr:hypothetical protein [Ignavibacteriales bacterium]
MKILKTLIIVFAIFSSELVYSYPIDGYLLTNIRRLLRIQLILDGKIKDKEPIKGARKSINDIKLNLTNSKGDSLASFPKVDAVLQKRLNSLFPNLNESYSICVLDVTKGKKTRYAERQSERRFVPGSVGKLAILAGLFTELQTLCPNSFEKRREILKTRFTKAGKWAIVNIHTVPFFDPETHKFFKRTVQQEDVFSLYEWTDHMISVSSNAAASIVWKELILMRTFGKNYPVSVEKEAEFFAKTPKKELKEIAMSVVNDPLRKLEIDEKDWHLGSLFTSEAKKIVPGEGGSFATPLGLMQYLVALERGKIVDKESSLEIKRILYQTDRRIRYAQSSALKDAAVYFKSGSLYKCKAEEGFECKKYMGNVENYMNSVIIVEHEDGTTYMVTLMSNVLRKNSGSDHMALASQIDKVIRQK